MRLMCYQMSKRSSYMQPTRSHALAWWQFIGLRSRRRRLPGPLVFGHADRRQYNPTCLLQWRLRSEADLERHLQRRS